MEKNIEEYEDNKAKTTESNNIKCKSVFISGIPYLLKESELKDLFNECGEIKYYNK